ncbi:MerR family transcriptional regulator [Piscinibacter sakaiensis]|uniref:Transcriptional regulator, MerR family n=1 Tax=Piscinibacter sakaiensis TaxID=1547922 RepID=A0A0K8P538_PISS1|nr:MerR family transcriptional regulator [Piscinibacter sakaiensis]GAP37310.1 transcriptional regulator, MerR family [Piscinibacter sakaiensis]
MEKSLPAIPAKRYFTIGEVSELCGVKPYVLRYWEQEFSQLKPMKRRGNRRYYQHHEVLLIRRIRDLLYDQGFTISGARNRLNDSPLPASMMDGLDVIEVGDDGADEVLALAAGDAEEGARAAAARLPAARPAAYADAGAVATAIGSPLAAEPAAPASTRLPPGPPIDARAVRSELLAIRALLG